MKIGFWFFGIVCITVFFAGQTPVFAVTSNTVFKVRAFVGVDTTPPTTPVLQSVVPVAPTQIDITWLPSTDDVLLIGYRLFRDGVQIATTSQTSFNDGGLTPETMYMYTVDAYDSFDNISSTSLAMATTTPPVPVPPPATTTTPSSTGASHQTSTIVTALQSPVEIIPAQRSAVLKWQTNTNTRYTIMWGRTASYELGSVSTNVFKQSHETTIENLEPGTHYWYSIIVTDGSGATAELKSSDFVTLPAFQSTLPPNVRNVQATVHGSDVSLVWQNPTLEDGDVVRVVRSHLFYPTSPTDGAVVYEGDGTNIQDLGALAVRSPQYYTIFVIDRNGAVSSGAVVTVRSAVTAPAPTAPGSHTALPAPDASSSDTESTTTPDIIESGSPVVLGAEGVFIRQGSMTQVLATPIKLDAEQLYTVYVPIAAVAPHIKSIIVTVQDPTDQRLFTSYLLKLNQNGDAYEAVLQAPHVVGASRMTVEVFDFYQASVRRISTTVLFTTPKSLPVVFPDDIVHAGQMYAVPVVSTVAGVGLFWWLVFWWRRRREDNN